MKKADLIKYELMKWAGQNAYDIILPNFFVDHYEMDLFKLSKAGFITEYEIKISRGDYLQDFRKGDKHTRMMMKISACNRFFFVVPKGLLKKEDVPPYVGLIYWSSRGFETVKPAPLIHKKPVDGAYYKSLALKLSYRDQIIRRKAFYWKAKHDQLKRMLK